MARCNCSGATCSCVIKAGANVSITGNGRGDNPYVITAETGGGEGSPSDAWLPGDLKWSSRATPGAGWLLADGSSVSRTTYPALFAAIGTTYGPGDGVSTFALPDYTGRFMLGSDNSHPRGSVGGAAAHELTMQEIPQHAHSIDHNHEVAESSIAGGHNHPPVETTQSGAHTHPLSFSDDPGGSMSHIPRGEATGPDTSRAAIGSDGGHTHNVNIEAVAGHSHNVNLPLFEGSSGNAGQVDPDPVPTMPPYATALPLIKT